MKVSIIIPVFNAEKFISKCVESIINQTYKNTEIIIVDDGSFDTSYSLCKTLSEKDSRIKLIKQSNKGVSYARNTGLDNVNGEYVMFVDADDYLPENSVELLVNNVTNITDLVIGSYFEFRNKKIKKIARAEIEYTAKSLRADIRNYDLLINTPWAKLYRYSIIKENGLLFDVGLPLGEDHAFNLHFSKYINSAIVISDYVYYYRLGGVASSVKYYPEKIHYNISYLKSYSVLFDSENNVPETFLNKKIRDQFYGCIEHFIINCSLKTAKNKIIETINKFYIYHSQSVLYKVYSEEERNAIMNCNPTRLILTVYKKKGIKVILKKMRKFFYDIKVKK